MKFVTYNIQFSCGMDGQFDIARTAAAIGDADIIALQEVERFWKRSGEIDQPAELARLLPEHHWVFAPNMDMDASYRDGDNRLVNRRRQFGLMVMSKWPILSKRVLPLPKFGAVAHHSTQAGLLETVIDVPSGPIRVYTVHLSHLGSDIRKPQIEAVMDIIARAPDEGGVWCGGHPVESDGWTQGGEPPMPKAMLIAGDFNFTYDSPNYSDFPGPLVPNHGRLTSRSGYRDAWVVAGNAENEGITCPATPGAQEPSKRISKRIDYCLVNSDLWDHVINTWIDVDCQASDHLPVWVEFDL